MIFTGDSSNDFDTSESYFETRGVGLTEAWLPCGHHNISSSNVSLFNFRQSNFNEVLSSSDLTP